MTLLIALKNSLRQNANKHGRNGSSSSSQNQNHYSDEITIQSFQKQYDQMTENKEKLKDFSGLLIQQIDTMSDVAEAFSDFAFTQT